MHVARVRTELRESAGPLVILALALTLAVIGYAPGVGGSLHFDDPANLDGLRQVSDIASALRFISEGEAGPAGRPLALASFAPEAYAWPDAPSVFLHTNICLHLLNGMLVAWMLYLLGCARGASSRSTAWSASTAAAIWLLSPLLASSSLLIVQRMTTLSATFLLLGFIGYLYGRRSIEGRPWRALLVMSASVSLGTTLAFLTKENGALLPMVILATEATLLSAPKSKDVALRWKAWCAAFLLLPSAALAVYLVTRLPYGPSVPLTRGFTGADRLLTEARILWQYLYHAFLPAMSALGPFHDDQPVYTNWLEPVSALAVAGWIAVGAAAVAFRKRVPLLAFAVAWYLVGHSLESTTIPLELYFEHRNYVPLIGPIYAATAAALAVPSEWQRLAKGALAAYGALLAVVLFNTTSLWGQPALAAEVWANLHPDSERATQYLVRELVVNGDQPTARKVLRHYLERNPGTASAAVQILALSCGLNPDESHAALVDEVEADLKKPRLQRSGFSALQGLYRIAQQGFCRDVDRPTVYGLLETAAANPAYRAIPAQLHNFHVLMSEEAFARRDLDLTMHHIEAALAANYTMTTLMLGVDMLSSAGLYSAAQDFIEQARAHEPSNPLRALMWRRQLADLADNLRIASSHDHAKH